MPVRRLAPVLALLLLPTLCGAAAPDAADETVKKTLARAVEVAGGSGTRDEKLASLRAVARDILDTRAMGRHAMGAVLAAQPPEQQQEFLDLFDQIMVRTYLLQLVLFRNPRFEVNGSSRHGDTVIVDTKIVTTKDAYQVEYEMRERDSRWAATDVIVEGISLTDNYRDQFASLLRDRSFAELLELMRRKTHRAREAPQ